MPRRRKYENPRSDIDEVKRAHRRIFQEDYALTFFSRYPASLFHTERSSLILFRPYIGLGLVGVEEAILRTRFDLDKNKVSELLVKATTEFFTTIPPKSEVYLQRLYNVLTRSQDIAGKPHYRVVYGSDNANARLGAPLDEPVRIRGSADVTALLGSEYEDQVKLVEALERQYPEESGIAVEDVINRVYLLRAYITEGPSPSKGRIRKVQL